nr:DNA-3-methyladenine glycosylase [Actinomycetota bacterium]
RDLRKARGKSAETTPGEISLRLPYREPFAADALFGFLAARAVTGVEEFVEGTYRRTLRLPHGAGILALAEGEGHVQCGLRLEDMRDLGVAVQRCRRLLDLDADPVSVDAHLGEDPTLAPLVRERPGTRVPGSVDGAETAIRAVLGQQVSVAGARTLATRLVSGYGHELPETLAKDRLTHLFPEPADLARAGLEDARLPRARREALRGLAGVLADEDVALDSGVDRLETERRLLEVPGIGPWTASYIAMRALGDPDAFLPTDLGVRHAVSRLGYRDDAESLAERWRPWRAYAVQHLWASLEQRPEKERKSENREVAS